MEPIGKYSWNVQVDSFLISSVAQEGKPRALADA